MSAPKTLRASIQDAAFHARQMHRSLEDAAAKAQTRRAERKLSRLSRTVRHWAIELDPETHYRRRHKGQTARHHQPSTIGKG